jgi:phenylacetate-CoA ligase
VDYLASASRDFAESLSEDPSARELRVVVHDHGAGPFAGMRAKIKNVYVVHPS